MQSNLDVTPSPLRKSPLALLCRTDLNPLRANARLSEGLRFLVTSKRSVAPAARVAPAIPAEGGKRDRLADSLRCSQRIEDIEARKVPLIVRYNHALVCFCDGRDNHI